MAKPETLTQKDLITALAEAQGCSQTEAKSRLRDTLDVIRDHLVAGHAIRLTDLMTLTPKVQPPRTARNPATGASIEVPERRVVKVRLSQALKVRLNG